MNTFLVIAGTVSLFFAIRYYLFKLTFHPTEQFQDKNQSYVLIVFTSSETIGGGRVYIANLCKELAERGQNIIGLTSHGAPVQEDFRKAGIPFYTCNSFKMSRNKRYWQPGLRNAIYQICEKHTITVVHCNDTFELAAAQKVNTIIPLKTLFVSHVDAAPKAIDYLHKADARIAVDKKYADKVDAVFLPPFLNEDLFTTTSHNAESERLETTFGIQLKKGPVLCMLARFDSQMEKSQPLFLHALADIIHHKKRTVNTLLAGDGPSLERCKKIAAKLNLTGYVHFLGAVDQKKIPLILHNSNINLLIRKNEPFGITLLEAALTKTPSIIADSAGAANAFIFDNKTGMLFKNGNKEDLITKIIELLDNPELRKNLGAQAHKLFKREFSREHTVTKIISMYDALAKKREAV